MPSDMANTSLSANNLPCEEPGFVCPTMQKPKQSSQKKKFRMIKYRFILSNMTLEREGIVSLFLFDDHNKQINSDIVIILMQPLLHLGTVQEAAYEGD